MKALHLASLVLVSAVSLASAQTAAPKKLGGRTQLRPLNPPAKKAEVVVDISDSAIADDFELKDAPPPPVEPPKSPAMLVKPAADIPETTGEEIATPAPASKAEEPEGVQVRVEPGKSGAPVDSSKVKLLAPFPPKALAKAPAGWHLEHPSNVPPIVQEVTLENGSRLSLSIRPHVLVPDADGSKVVSISEPGYDPTQQYDQTKTMGAILSGSLERMDKDSRDLGDALERLQQLLGSLPHPPPPAATTVKPANSPR